METLKLLIGVTDGQTDKEVNTKKTGEIYWCGLLEVLHDSSIIPYAPLYQVALSLTTPLRSQILVLR